MLKKVTQYYQIISNLSVDVVIGVLANAWLVSHTFQSVKSVWWLLGLACGTWFIYLLDHVIDNVRGRNVTLSTRHYFIKKLGKSIWLLLVGLMLILFCCAWFSDDILLLISGVGVSAIILLHLLLARINPQKKSLFNNKEFGVALVYALSIYVYPLLQSYKLVQMEAMCYAFMLLLLITYQSLLLCSIVDYRIDKQLSNSSFVQVAGLVRSKLVFIGLSLALLGLIWLLNLFAIGIPVLLLVIYVVMCAGHILLYLLHQQGKRLPYRICAELLFWIPILVYFL